MISDVALDGGQVTVSGTGLTLGRRATSTWAVRGPGGVVHLCSGPLNTYRRILLFLHGFTPTDEYGHGEGVLHTGFAKEYDAWTFRRREPERAVLWQGPHSDVGTLGVVKSDTYLRDMFAEIAIRDTPRGASTRSADGRPLPGVSGAAKVTKAIDEIGLLTIEPLTDDRIAQLPKWSGHHTPNGEMFASSSADIPTVVIVTESAIATTSLLPGATDEAVEACSRLTVTWDDRNVA